MCYQGVNMEIGIDSFGAVISDPAAGLTLSPVQRTQNLLEEITLADKVIRFGCFKSLLLWI